MKLKLAEKWLEETFEKDSMPSVKDVKTWVSSGEVPGRVIGECVFVDADRFAYADQIVPQDNGLTAMGLLE